MPNYNTLSVDDPEFKRFRDAQPDGMSTSAFLRVLLDEFESHDPTAEDVTNADLAARLDDLKSSIPRETADELAHRFR